MEHKNKGRMEVGVCLRRGGLTEHKNKGRMEGVV